MLLVWGYTVLPHKIKTWTRCCQPSAEEEVACFQEAGAALFNGACLPGEGEVRPELEQAWWGPEQKAGKQDLKGSSSPGFAGLVADSVSCMPTLVPWGALTCTVLGNELKASAAAPPGVGTAVCVFRTLTLLKTLSLK